MLNSQEAMGKARGAGLKIVIGSLVGMTVCMPTLSFSYGLFMTEFERQFGWNRTQTSLSLTVISIGVFVGSFPSGYLADRFGSRLLATLSLSSVGLGLIAIPRFVDSLASLYLFYFCIAVLGFGTLPAVLLKPVVAAFSRRRGLAVGFALGGIGLGGALMPQLVAQLIVHGWRAAYVGVGLATLVGAMIVWATLPHGGRAHSGQASAAEAAAAPQEGLSFGEAVRTRNFWILSMISVLCIFGVGGFISHLVPYVRDNGFSAAQAAGLASLVGGASIGGRLLTGLLLDRFRVPATGAVLIALGMTGVMLTAVQGAAIAPLSVALVGFALGSEVDLIAYFASRYFGLRAHGAIFGWNYAMVALGSGLAPVAVGQLRDRTSGYTLAFWVLVAALFVAAVLCLLLGPYVYKAHPTEENGEAR